MLDLRQAERVELVAKIERPDEREVVSLPPRRPLGTRKPKVGRHHSC